MDVLLRKIQRQLRGSETIGAFADDIAVVVDNVWKSAPGLRLLFQEFEQISALSLNVKKTVLIPLWKFSHERNIRCLLKENCPGFANVIIDDKGKYLGFLIGPGAPAVEWAKALMKFEGKVSFWAGLKLGMAMNTVAFNIYIVTVLEFHAQLLEIDVAVQNAIDAALRKLAPGPGTWVTVRDLEHLKAFGMKHQFRTLDCTSKAAKLRVAASIAADCGEQREALQRSLMEDLRRPFGSWHCKPYFKVLCDNQRTLAAMGITLREVRSKAHSATSKRCKRNDNFQTVARAFVQTKTQPYDAEDRLRYKIKRWRLEGPPAHVASRLLNNIQIVGSKCRPCVAGMFFRTLWNA